VFRNRYTRLSSVEPGQMQVQLLPVPDIRQIVVFSNGRQGLSQGVEVAMSGTPRSWWRMHGSYSYLRQVTEPAAGYTGIEGKLTGQDPAHQAKMQSFWNLGRHWQADVSLYAVGRVTSRQVPGYLRADARISWRPARGQEWSLLTQDLFNHSRLEWDPELFLYAIPARRAVVLRWTTQF
jgi:iron complex outermembrane receptor protein